MFLCDMCLGLLSFISSSESQACHKKCCLCVAASVVIEVITRTNEPMSLARRLRQLAGPQAAHNRGAASTAIGCGSAQNVACVVHCFITIIIIYT
jgi:hypothetical protein